ncbi:MAG: DUF169 domain-containing protein [Desulfovibrio sp.]|nr:DUF169 domain-containing protein [Desulfovibrio sp.]
MALNWREMEETLMTQLRLYHHPVAVTWLFTEEDVARFRQTAPHVTPVKALTYCQWEVAARMQGKTVLGTADKLACTNAQVSFGWRDIDEREIRTQLKYCVDEAQAERFIRSKPRMETGSVRAVVVGPLGEAVMPPHVVHFYCDSVQAYHLAVDYMAATDTHPLRPQITMSSSCCGGSVFCWQQKTFNHCPPCSGSYNAGKTERGETNVFIPGHELESVVQRLLQRIERSGSSSVTRPGDYFPGGDVCKNCPLIAFREGESGAEVCADCKK